MPTLPAWNANIAHNAANPSAGREDSCAFAPDFVEFIEERVVICDLAKLIFVFFVFFQRPIRRRGDDEMDASIRNPREIACVAEPETMFSAVERCWPRMRTIIRVECEQLVDRT